MQNLTTSFETIDFANLDAVVGGYSGGDDKRAPTFGERVNRTLNAGARWATPGAIGGGVVGGVVGAIATSPGGPAMAAGAAAGAGIGGAIGGLGGFIVGAGGSIINQIRGH